MCTLSRFTPRRLADKENLEESKRTSPPQPLFVRGPQTTPNMQGCRQGPRGRISPLGLMTFLRHTRPSPSSVPDDTALNAGAGFLWSSEAPYRQTTSLSEMHTIRELPTQGRVTGDVRPSPHAVAGLIYLTCLWQTFIHYV